MSASGLNAKVAEHNGGCAGNDRLSWGLYLPAACLLSSLAGGARDGDNGDDDDVDRGRAKVRVLTEMSLFFLSQINTFNATSSLNKKCNKFMY